MNFLWSLVIAALLLQVPAADDERASISGRCLSAQTGEPLKSVDVQLNAAGGHSFRQGTLSAA
ncbi:MAG TPA: hypothetical protein VEU62_04010, partial [Bryobacterales bacterium]|nr:hypothetical protein [Bryobacterales bacterium]